MTSFRGANELGRDLRRQARFVRPCVPVYARLLALLDDELDTGLRARLDAVWSQRTFVAWYDRPLLLLAAIRAGVLRDGQRHALWPALGRDTPTVDGLTRETVRPVLAESNTQLWDDLRCRTVQTNELSRAVAWMWPATLLADVDPRVDLHLFDIGASAGLNLVADRVSLRWHDGAGDPLSLRLPSISIRTGFDLAPLDASSDDANLWLTACVWPGLSERVERLQQAIAAWRALQGSDEAPAVHRLAAADVPGALPTPPENPSSFALAYQTVMRGYLSADESVRYEAGMHDWLRRNPGRSMWIELEPADDEPERSARLTVHVAPHPNAVETFEIARTHPHPKVLFVDHTARQALCACLDGARNGSLT